MPVTLTPRPDGKTWVKVRKAPKENQFTGKDRKGFNSKSGAAVLTDPILALTEQPTVEKPAALIKHLRIIGAKGKGDKVEDVLTASGHALYEFLMASARLQGIENTEFRVPVEDAKKYLRIEHNDRLKSLVKQLRDTEVEYDFRVPGYSRNGTMPLLLPDWITLDSGKRLLAFSIHEAVKYVILNRHHYTKLEINAFPLFSCKYTARIYPRLAMIAGYDKLYRSWKVSPEELARDIGFQFSGDFHFGNFEKGALRKVKADMDQHVTRLTATYEVVRKPGRGNPVDHILFLVEPREAPLQEQRKAPMTAEQYAAANASLKNENSFWGEMPSTELLRQGATLTGHDALDLLDLWKTSLSQMHAYPSMSLPDADLVTGAELSGLLHDQGIAAAFAHWCSFLKRKVVIVEPVQPHTNGPENAWGGTVVESDPTSGYRMIVFGRDKNARSESPFKYQELVNLITADDAAAVAHCDGNHDAWRFFSNHLVDGEEVVLLSAMKIASLPKIAHSSRIAFLTRLLRKAAAAKSYDIGKVVCAVCREEEKRMRLELAAA